MNMKMAVSHALAQIARDPIIPQNVKEAYNREFIFGSNYLIPTPFDPRIKEVAVNAVIEAAIKDKVNTI
jgi:malate dehydrogenase (oxaloacetate-decarboxylating)(NADP+)